MRHLLKVAFLGCFLGVALVPGSAAKADEVFTFVIKKQEEKAKSRWSLAEWIDTRDRIRMMDLWLAFHSPSPYEFYLRSDYRLSDSGGKNTGGNLRLAGAAYASIFGLEAEKSLSNGGPWLALFDLRIFGFHVQGTNITLQAGLRSEGDPAIRSAAAGVASSIYVFRSFGIDGYWRHYFDSAPNAAGVKTSGGRYQVGGFIDFSFLRAFGSFFSESIDTVSASGLTPSSREGVLTGVQLFF